MVFLHIALPLFTLSSALALPPSDGIHLSRARSNGEYSAKAWIEGRKYNISALATFLGGYGKPTWVEFSDIKGLTTNPDLGGPFLYHIHTNPIPPDGNCTKALAHLDPLNVTEGFVASPEPEVRPRAQIGDLSGKYGKINGTSDGKVPDFGYDAVFLRWYPEDFTLLGRSIVIHASDKTRLACGNITSPLDGTADWSGKPTYQPSNYVKDYPTVAPVQPNVSVPLNKSGIENEAIYSTFPIPLAEPALSVVDAPNVQLTTITHSVKYDNTEQTITQPKAEKSDEKPPF